MNVPPRPGLLSPQQRQQISRSKDHPSPARTKRQPSPTASPRRIRSPGGHRPPSPGRTVATANSTLANSGRRSLSPATQRLPSPNARRPSLSTLGTSGRRSVSPVPQRLPSPNPRLPSPHARRPSPNSRLPSPSARRPSPNPPLPSPSRPLANIDNTARTNPVRHAASMPLGDGNTPKTLEGDDSIDNSDGMMNPMSPIFMMYSKQRRNEKGFFTIKPSVPSAGSSTSGSVQSAPNSANSIASGSLSSTLTSFPYDSTTSEEDEEVSSQTMVGDVTQNNGSSSNLSSPRSGTPVDELLASAPPSPSMGDIVTLKYSLSEGETKALTLTPGVSASPGTFAPSRLERSSIEASSTPDRQVGTSDNSVGATPLIRNTGSMRPLPAPPALGGGGGAGSSSHRSAGGTKPNPQAPNMMPRNVSKGRGEWWVPRPSNSNPSPMSLPSMLGAPSYEVSDLESPVIVTNFSATSTEGESDIQSEKSTLNDTATDIVSPAGLDSLLLSAQGDDDDLYAPTMFFEEFPPDVVERALGSDFINSPYQDYPDDTNSESSSRGDGMTRDADPSPSVYSDFSTANKDDAKKPGIQPSARLFFKPAVATPSPRVASRAGPVAGRTAKEFVEEEGSRLLGAGKSPFSRDNGMPTMSSSSDSDDDSFYIIGPSDLETSGDKLPPADYVPKIEKELDEIEEQEETKKDEGDDKHVRHYAWWVCCGRVALVLIVLALVTTVLVTLIGNDDKNTSDMDHSPPSPPPRDPLDDVVKPTPAPQVAPVGTGTTIPPQPTAAPTRIRSPVPTAPKVEITAEPTSAPTLQPVTPPPIPGSVVSGEQFWNDFVLDIDLRWEHQPGSVEMQITNALDDSYHATLDTVLQRWQTSERLNLNITTTNPPKPGLSCYGELGRIKICSGSYGNTTDWRGTSQLYLQGRDIVAAVILFNDDFDEPTPEFDEYTMCHQLGHAFGLFHSRGGCMSNYEGDGADINPELLFPGIFSLQDLDDLYGDFRRGLRGSKASSTLKRSGEDFKIVSKSFM